MKTGIVLGVAGLAGMTVVLGQLNADVRDDAPSFKVTQAGGETAEAGGTVGPDVIVGALTGPRYWTQDSTEVAYSIGTTSCNLGDMDLEWLDGGGDNRHPVIGQNMFRINGDGRLIQIGQSWLKHGFCALQGTLCGSCDPACGGCCDSLGPGCSDPYSASRNGGQSGLGPKWEVNPHTGEFPIPWDQGEGTSGELRRRLRVKVVFLVSSLDPTAQFLMEGQYVTQDDAFYGNQNNNASYIRVGVNQTGTYSATFIGGTEQMKPAVVGWSELVDGVAVTEAQVENDGLYMVGHRAYATGEGDYMYEYAVYNMNSDRGAGSFEVPVPAGVDVTDIGFHDVDYHSGEAWDSTDWTSERAANSVIWSNGTDYETQPEANAIRWGTVYTMWFRSSAEPADVDATIHLFKPSGSDPASITASVVGPLSSCTPTSGDTNDDGSVDVEDLLNVLADWGCIGAPGDCLGDTNCDGSADVVDLLDVLGNWSS